MMAFLSRPKEASLPPGDSSFGSNTCRSPTPTLNGMLRRVLCEPPIHRKRLGDGTARQTQCSDLLCKMHRSHRWKVHRNHRNDVPWHPLSLFHRRQRGIPIQIGVKSEHWPTDLDRRVAVDLEATA
jgi:hypothetical protein